MMLDCRPFNRMFRNSPRTDLITGEGLSEIEFIDESFKSSGLCVHFGCADVDACFHRLLLRGKICEYFGWGHGDQVVWRVIAQASCCTHPEITTDGLQLATYSAQSVSCKLLGDSLPLLRGHPLIDRSCHKVRPCQRDTAVHHAYTDNMCNLGCKRVCVEDAVGRAKDHCESKGLKLHELDVRSDVASTF